MPTIINGDGVVTAGGTASTQGKVVLAERTGSGTNTVTIQAPATLAADLTFTMPTADGTNGQYLQTNGSGQLAFATVPTTSPAGSTGQVQYNNAGAFGAISSGTSGQVLTSAGAGAAPTWATPSAGAVAYLGTYSTSSATSLQVPLSSFTSTYNAFRLLILNLRAVSSASQVFPFLRINASSSGYYGMIGGGRMTSGSGTFAMSNDSTSGVPLISDYTLSDSASGSFVNADISFFNMDTSSQKNMVGSIAYRTNPSPTTVAAGGIGGIWSNSATPTSIDIVDTYSPQRNLAVTAILYGIKTS